MTPELETFFIDWSITFAIGGGVCALIGLVTGWIIWKNTRKLTEEIESQNREALSDYEKSSDEVSKIRAELTSDH